MPLHFTDDAYSDDDDFKIGKIIFSDTDSDNDGDFMLKASTPRPSTSKASTSKALALTTKASTSKGNSIFRFQKRFCDF